MPERAGQEHRHAQEHGRHDSESPPIDRLEHALTVLMRVKDELSAAVARAQDTLSKIEPRVAELDNEVDSLKVALGRLERRLASDSLADAALAAETTSRVGRLTVELAQLHAARSAAVGEVAASGAEAARAVKSSGRLGVTLNGILALIGILAAGAKWLSEIW